MKLMGMVGVCGWVALNVAFGEPGSTEAGADVALPATTVVVWGAGITNSNVLPHYGQSQIPNGLTNAVAVAAGGYHSTVLKSDGTVIAWGSNTKGPPQQKVWVISGQGSGSGSFARL